MVIAGTGSVGWGFCKAGVRLSLGHRGQVPNYTGGVVPPVRPRTWVAWGGQKALDGCARR